MFKVHGFPGVDAYLLILLSIGQIQGLRETNSVDGPGILESTVGTILFDDEILAVGVDEEADEVWSHIMSALVC